MCDIEGTISRFCGRYGRTDLRCEPGSVHSGVEAELSGALHLLHSDKEPLSHYSGDSGCIPENNMTVSPAQTVSPGSDSSCGGQRG